MTGFGTHYGFGQYAFDMDGDPPFLYDQSPPPGATGADYGSSVAFDVLSFSGLNLSSLTVYVGGSLVVSGGGFQPGFSGSMSPVTLDAYGGYRVVVDAIVPAAPATVQVHVLASDFEGNPLDGYYSFQTKNRLESLVCEPYETTLVAGFSSPMLLSTLLDASKYQLSGGAYVRGVEAMPPGSAAPSSVLLWVERFTGTGSFTLTLSSSLLDANGDPLAATGRTAQISPFQSSAHFSNTAGLVRSWHESRLIMRDSLRAYLADTRGMDVFDISHNIGNPTRWAQVLDAYGTKAACVLGTEDFMFEDTQPPFLANRVPAPGASGVSLGTTVRLSVADETTAVEAVAIAVYVNSRLAFSGATGWTNGYGGQVLVNHQIVDVLLYPPPGGIVVGSNTVAVLAADLVGNLLDTAYTFTVGAPPPTGGGFGTSGFGTAPFGV